MAKATSVANMDAEAIIVDINKNSYGIIQYKGECEK